MNIPEPRILAIDLRSQFFGFAVLEGPVTLLDFGRTFFFKSGHQSNVRIVRKKMVALLNLYVPAVIVLKRTSGRLDRTLAGNKGAFEAIRREADLRSLELVLLKRRDIYQALQQSGRTNKDKIADFIAGRFPAVEWKLPPRRKNWHPEYHIMTVFDAISVGLAYFAQRREIFSIDPRTEAKTPN